MFSESTYLKTLVVAMHLVHSDPAPFGYAVQFYDGFTMALASGVKTVAEKSIRNVKEGKRRSKQVRACEEQRGTKRRADKGACNWKYDE